MFERRGLADTLILCKSAMAGLWMKAAGMVKGKKHAVFPHPPPQSDLSVPRRWAPSHTGKPAQPRWYLRKEWDLSSHHVCIYCWAAAPHGPKLVHPSGGPEFSAVVLYSHMVWGHCAACGEGRSVRCWFAWAECCPSSHDLAFPRVHTVHKVSSNSGTQQCYFLLKSMLEGCTLQMHAFGLNSQ